MSKARGEMAAATPYFIVSDFAATARFYTEQLGFEVSYATPASQPFYGRFVRDGVAVMLRAADPGVTPTPNAVQQADALWDAYVYCPDPDALHAELSARGAACGPLEDTGYGIRKFEVADPDGYVLCFARLLDA